jgi:hypothetical protein
MGVAAVEAYTFMFRGEAPLWPSGDDPVVIRRQADFSLWARLDPVTGVVETYGLDGEFAGSVELIPASLFTPAMFHAVATGASADTPYGEIPDIWKPDRFIFLFSPETDAYFAGLKAAQSLKMPSAAQSGVSSGGDDVARITSFGIDRAAGSFEFGVGYDAGALPVTNLLDVFHFAELGSGHNPNGWMSRFEVATNVSEAVFTLDSSTVFAERLDDFGTWFAADEKVFSHNIISTNKDYGDNPMMPFLTGGNYVAGEVKTQAVYNVVWSAPGSGFFRRQ